MSFRFCIFILIMFLGCFHAHASDVSELFNQGLAKNSEGVYDQGLEYLKQAAAGGFPRAFTVIGIMYKNGEGVKQDYFEAVRWFEKAVAAGDINGILKLATMYETGRGVNKDLQQALKLYKRVRDEENVEFPMLSKMAISKIQMIESGHPDPRY